MYLGAGGWELKLIAELEGDVLQHCNPQFEGVLQTELSDRHSKYDTLSLPQIDWPGSLTLNLKMLKGD